MKLIWLVFFRSRCQCWPNDEWNFRRGLAFAVVVAAQVAGSAAVVVVVEVVGIVADVEVTGGPADPESQARGRSGPHYPRQSRSRHPERYKKKRFLKLP